MSDSKDQSTVQTGEKDGEAPLETACDQLKAAMEKCITTKGEESCEAAAAAYRDCMKRLGFNV
uniref:COX17-like, cytochrome c oxidase assembly protein n=1 Tax=Callorhinchus milii TaxID=7868 RepID=V9LHS4_CALMI